MAHYQLKLHKDAAKPGRVRIAYLSANKPLFFMNTKRVLVNYSAFPYYALPFNLA